MPSAINSASLFFRSSSLLSPSSDSDSDSDSSLSSLSSGRSSTVASATAAAPSRHLTFGLDFLVVSTDAWSACCASSCGCTCGARADSPPLRKLIELQFVASNSELSSPNLGATAVNLSLNRRTKDARRLRSAPAVRANT
jgi:hypothetical protein